MAPGCHTRARTPPCLSCPCPRLPTTAPVLQQCLLHTISPPPSSPHSRSAEAHGGSASGAAHARRSSYLQHAFHQTDDPRHVSFSGLRVCHDQQCVGRLREQEQAAGAPGEQNGNGAAHRAHFCSGIPSVTSHRPANWLQSLSHAVLCPAKCCKVGLAKLAAQHDTSCRASSVTTVIRT